MRGMLDLALLFVLMVLCPSTADMSLFLLQRPEVTMYLLVYVDDIILVSSSDTATDRLIAALGSDFAVKDLGQLHYFLGLEVSRSADGLALSQKKYSTDVCHGPDFCC